MLKTDVRPGGYYDSIVLMQLQAALADLPGELPEIIRRNLATRNSPDIV